jgi:hypothetical protein
MKLETKKNMHSAYMEVGKMFKKLPTKKLVTSAAIITSLAFMPSIVQVSEAANVSMSDVAYETSTGDRFIITLDDYADAYLDGSGNLYNLLTKTGTKIIGIGLEDGRVVDYEKISDSLIDNYGSGKSSLEILASVATTHVLSENLKKIVSFDGGNPKFSDSPAQEEKPLEVISIN